MRIIVMLYLAMHPAAAGAADADAVKDRQAIAVLHDRCVDCHGATKQKGGLRLDSRASILAGNDHGPAAAPGKPALSALIKAVLHHSEPTMPPKQKLPAGEAELLVKWVERGLNWPDPASGADTAGSPPTFEITAEQLAWWSFQPLVNPALPRVREVNWCADDLDRFVLARLEEARLKPAPRADPATLLRRATFDLTGLPPTPDESAAFLADPSSEAYARVIDRLLASPRYGERWARHWLDLVRYADTLRLDVGKEFENISYHYRDWVVRSFNCDLPFDQFVIRQLAGDLLPFQSENEQWDHRIATGVLTMAVWQDQDRTDPERIRAEIVDQQIDLVGRTFLGLTLSCARCHNHKFDPISAADYYGLAGIFSSTNVIGVGEKSKRMIFPVATDEELKTYDQARKRIGVIEKRLRDLTKPAPKPADAALTTNAKPAEKPVDPAEIAALRTELAQLQASKDILYGLCAEEVKDKGKGKGKALVRDSAIFVRGDHKTKGEIVPRRFPQVLAGTQQPTLPSTSSGRLQLAQWLADRKNPLTARVLVNRVWMHHLGAGIVRTPGNFGKLGDPPSHPELLDYLADRFVADGWSLKALHRAIMLSATYRQSSIGQPETIKADPDNRWFGRMHRHRLEAEQIRDALLAISGRLDLAKTAGPAVQDDVARTLFQHISRRGGNDFLMLFDGPDPLSIIDRREVTTVAPQALFLLNNTLVMEAGIGLARRARLVPGDHSAQVAAAYRLAFNRDPTPSESAHAATFLGTGGFPVETGQKSASKDQDAWSVFAQALLCSNEFLFID